MTVVAPGTLESLHFRRLTAAAVACFVLSLGGCSDYFAQREMESTLAHWIGSSPTLGQEFVKPIAYAKISKDAIDVNSPLGESLDEAVSRLGEAGIGYAIQVSGHTFDLVSANDRRLIFRRRNGGMSVKIDLIPKNAKDSVEILVSTLEITD
ncbi:MAG: hypothetical protein DCC68_20405 [Planctomycetota bacterium]|nr:MAG: hypothetical protein DCC68_20405 [Planctomycetota bacterium]